MAAKTTQRSLKLLRDEGWPLVQVVEKWIPQAKRHIDLFGFCDILAMHPVWGHLYVQTTSYGNVSARLKKIRECERAGIVLQEPNSRIDIHGWHKHGLKGKRKIWKVRKVSVSLSEYYEVDKNDWEAIYRVMQQVDHVIPLNDSEGYCSITSRLESYPPRIELFLKYQQDDKYGTLRAHTPAELATASQLIGRMVDKATDKYDWLVLKDSWPPVVGGKGFVLRPENYSELAEMLKTQLL